MRATTARCASSTPAPPALVFLLPAYAVQVPRVGVPKPSPTPTGDPRSCGQQGGHANKTGQYTLEAGMEMRGERQNQCGLCSHHYYIRRAQTNCG